MGHGDLELLRSRFRHHADNTGALRNLLASPDSNLPQEHDAAFLG
jgi:hypothetical protein